MTSVGLLFELVEFFALPFAGLFILALSKLTTGSLSKLFEKWFIGVLIAVTLITCRTVIHHESCWLAHTATLGLMVVGSLLIPNREHLIDRRSASDYRYSIHS